MHAFRLGLLCGEAPGQAAKPGEAEKRRATQTARAVKRPNRDHVSRH
jgi:hypothetical protein